MIKQNCEFYPGQNFSTSSQKNKDFCRGQRLSRFTRQCNYFVAKSDRPLPWNGEKLVFFGA